MLSEVVGSEKLLARVAFAELVHFLQMPEARLPVLLCRLASAPSRAAATELVTTEATYVRFAWLVCALVESVVVAVFEQSRAGPAVSPHVETVLMALGLVLVLEAVATERAFVLLFSLMRAR